MRSIVPAIVCVLLLAACGSGGQDAGRPGRSGSTVTPTTDRSASTVASSTPAPGPPETTGPPDDGPTIISSADPGPGTGPLPDVVVLTCDGTGATLSAHAVLTRADGIHVTVHNTSGAEAALNLVDRGEVVPPGETATVQDMAPRTLVVSCGYDQNRVVVAAGTVEVVDRAGHWRPTTIDCSRMPLVDWGPESMGVGATPEEAVRWWAANRPDALQTPIAPNDEIVLVGYPEARSPRYVSRREGKDTNIFRLDRGPNGWTATPNENCPR